MNPDFILFSAPKIKYTFLDVWGEVIFIPCYGPKKETHKSSFFSFANCYNAPKTSEVYFSI